MGGRYNKPMGKHIPEVVQLRHLTPDEKKTLRVAAAIEEVSMSELASRIVSEALAKRQKVAA
jgi:hypothetical protein